MDHRRAMSSSLRPVKSTVFEPRRSGTVPGRSFNLAISRTSWGCDQCQVEAESSRLPLVDLIAIQAPGRMTWSAGAECMWAPQRSWLRSGRSSGGNCLPSRPLPWGAAGIKPEKTHKRKLNKDNHPYNFSGCKLFDAVRDVHYGLDISGI